MLLIEPVLLVQPARSKAEKVSASINDREAMRLTRRDPHGYYKDHHDVLIFQERCCRLSYK
jgi:hypothetical protein